MRLVKCYRLLLGRDKEQHLMIGIVQVVTQATKQNGATPSTAGCKARKHSAPSVCLCVCV